MERDISKSIALFAATAAASIPEAIREPETGLAHRRTSWPWREMLSAAKGVSDGDAGVFTELARFRKLKANMACQARRRRSDKCYRQTAAADPFTPGFSGF